MIKFYEVVFAPTDGKIHAYGEKRLHEGYDLEEAVRIARSCDLRLVGWNTELRVFDIDRPLYEMTLCEIYNATQNYTLLDYADDYD